MTFSGFPRTTLLEAGRLPLEELAERARCEGQSTRPIYRVHRWFARRLSTQFRSILAALTLEPREADQFWKRYNEHIPLDGAVVLDPFVGGGTTVIESSRCGAAVIGFDIDPVAASITRFELSARTRERDLAAAQSIVASVAETLRSYYITTLDDGRETEVLHYFWVEETTCSECGHAFELHPYYQLAWDNDKGLQWAFCKHCHEVQELPLARKRLDCGCGRRTRIKDGTQFRGKIQCPQCQHTWNLSEGSSEQPPRWRLFALEVLEPVEDGCLRTFKRATASDHAAYATASAALREMERTASPFPPSRPIPEEPRFDRRPLIHGIRSYDQLFNDRQRLHLTILGRAIAGVENEGVKRLLSLAYSEHLTTNCMYTGYAFGYRRTSPLFSIHGYRHIVRPVELNPWLDGIGRGTFINSLSKIGRAIAYASAPDDLASQNGSAPAIEPIGPADGCVIDDPEQVCVGKAKAAVCARSSADLRGIPDGDVNLILTDPPYFDNISYSELSDFYLAWHQQLGIAEGVYRAPGRSAPLSENLAIVDRSDSSVATYTHTLASIFAECNRVLHPDGLMVFTYHHKAPEAWVAVGMALAHSGLQCTSVIPMRGEGDGGLHSKNGTIKWDAVLVCRKSGRRAVHISDLTAVVVGREALEGALAATNRFASQLSQPKTAFREPDRLNLLCAMVAASAQADRSADESLPLEEALQEALRLFDAQRLDPHRAYAEA